MSDFTKRIRDAQADRLRAGSSMDGRTPMSIDKVVDFIATEIENRIVKTARREAPHRISTYESGFWKATKYEYQGYIISLPIQFYRAPCTSVRLHPGGESDWDNECFRVDVKNVDEVKQIASALLRRLYANNIQVERPTKERGKVEYYTLADAVEHVQKETDRFFVDVLHRGEFTHIVVGKTRVQ